MATTEAQVFVQPACGRQARALESGRQTNFGVAACRGVGSITRRAKQIPSATRFSGLRLLRSP